MRTYLVILFFVFHNSLSQNHETLSFINYSDKDGLTDKYIYSIAQDKNNLMWFGTGSGLFNFDGQKFNKVKSPIDKPGRQISNTLQNIYRDRSGKLWLSSMNAMQVFDPVQRTFSATNYSDPIIDKMIKSFIMGFTEDSKGNIWIATQTNFWYKYNRKTKKAVQFVPKDAFVNEASKDVLKIIQTPDKKLWAITTNGMFEFSENGTIKPHWNLKNKKHHANSFYDGFYDKSRNCIWLAGGYDGIVQFSLKDFSFENKPLIVPNSKNSNPANFVTLVAPKDKNTLWFTSGNLGEYNISNKHFYNFEMLYKDEYSYKTSPVSRLFHDRENNLWIASYAGLSMLPWQNNQIKSYPLFNSFANYTIEPYGSILYQGGYLIANNTSNGLIWLDTKTKKTNFIQNPYYLSQYRNMKGIVSIVKTPKNQIYCTSYEHFFILNQIDNSLIPISVKDQNGKSPVNVVKMISDSSGNIYMTSLEKGFYIFNTQSRKLKHFPISKIIPSSFLDENSNLSARMEDKQGNIWFTKTKGVLCWQKSSEKFKYFGLSKAKNNGAIISQSIDIAQDRKGHYWITTLDNGLFELTLENGKETLLNYTKENSNLPADYCANIFTDKNGLVWFGTSYGLVQFNPNTKKVTKILGKQHGFKDNYAAVAVNFLNNEIVVNHYGQLSVLNLDSYKVNSIKPKVRFTQIKVLDKILTSNEIKENLIELKHNENFVTIDWFSDVYNNANQNGFAYQLSGVDDKWIYSDKNSVSYSNLSHGTYTFKVKSANNDGIWSEVAILNIIIATPIYKSWWFYGLLFLFVSGILFAFYRFKMNQVKKEESIKTAFAQQIAEIEMKALRAQMNPHFIFNSLNSIQKYILKNDSFAASQYLTKFSKLIRLILDHSNQNFILLSSEIDLLKLYIETECLRFDNQFEYEIKVDDSLNTENIQIPSMIIQPYIENAIWHGLLHKETKGKLTLEIIRFDKNTIKVLVADDGIGRQKAQELKSKQVLKKKSYGLQITEDRISILNKTQSNKTTLKIHDLKDKNNIALGTQVELIIPFQNIN